MKLQTHTLATFLSLALVLMLGGFTQAADEVKPSVNTKDEKFIKDFGASGMSEVKIAELATGKAERADVKEFATMLVTDHSKLNTEVADLAKSKNVQLSAVIEPKGADEFKDLEKESGKAFDRAFLKHMAKCHDKSIDALEDAEKNATDGDLKSWASKTLPMVRSHLDKIKELQGKDNS